MINATIGQPIDHNGTIGHIVGITTPQHASYTLGTGKMERIRQEFEVITPEGYKFTVPDSVAAPMLERAIARGLKPSEDVEGLKALADEVQHKAALERAESGERAKAAREVFEAECRKVIPAWAKAVIMAELEEDKCDSMSDYYATATKRRVIIGFSAHKRDLFPELRKASLGFPETAHLATASDKAEHREKYSMGAGYYLKDSHRYSSGWKVSKESLNNGLPYCTAEFHLTAPIPGQKTETPTGIIIEKHIHTKKGFEMHICILPGRVERAEFEALRNKAEAMGGWYSRPWGKTPGGFAFKALSDAEAFRALDAAIETENDPMDDFNYVGSKHHY